MIVFKKNMIEPEIMTGSGKGKTFSISRRAIIPSDYSFSSRECNFLSKYILL
jgi:hypothetical protein